MVVYDTDGLFVRTFRGGTLMGWSDITAANDGRVMVVQENGSCVYIFSEDGDYLDKFKLQGHYYYPSIAFHQLTEHVVIADKKEEESVVVVEIFTKDGKFVRSTQMQSHEIQRVDVRGMPVTRDGRIAVLLSYMFADGKCKVLVI